MTGTISLAAIAERITMLEIMCNRCPRHGQAEHPPAAGGARQHSPARVARAAVRRLPAAAGNGARAAGGRLRDPHAGGGAAVLKGSPGYLERNG
jgi:hypothetical protein